MEHSFGKLYSLCFYKPAEAFTEILAGKRKLKYAFLAVSIMAFLYTLVYIFLAIGKGLPYKPWLPIEPEVYYRYNIFFLGPSMFCGWFLAAAVAHYTGRLFKSKGTFTDILILYGFGIGIASWATGLHDLITSFMGAIGVIDQRQYELLLNTPTVWRTLLWIQMIAYLLWFIALFSIGCRVSQMVSRPVALFTGTVAFIVYQLFFFIFNR